MDILKNFWTNKLIVVTGAGGFVGTHLARKLNAVGAKVEALSWRNDGIDIRSQKALTPIFLKKPSVVFHLAGEALVEKGHESPYETYLTNILGTLNVLELSRIYEVPRIIIASSVQVYGSGTPPFHENNTPLPSRPYETSKTITDLLAQSYADSFKLPVIIPRFVNIYGPGDINFTRLIPKTLQFIIRGKPVPMWGGKSKREYLFVNDAVEAYLMLAALPHDKLEKNRIFNFGAGPPVTVESLIYRIGELSGLPLKVEKIKNARSGELLDQYVSWDKARRVLGWKPKFSLDEGLRQTIAWYKEYLYTTFL